MTNAAYNKIDEYNVEIRLREWGKAESKSLEEGLGCPSESAFCKLRSSGSFKSFTPDNPRIEEIAKIITTMSLRMPELWYQVIRTEYINLTDYKFKWKELNISRRTYFTNLKLAKTYIRAKLEI